MMTCPTTGPLAALKCWLRACSVLAGCKLKGSLVFQVAPEILLDEGRLPAFAIVALFWAQAAGLRGPESPQMACDASCIAHPASTSGRAPLPAPKFL